MSDVEEKNLHKIIGHEINNPLMVIQISLDRLKTLYPGIEEDKSFIYIEKSANRIKEAVSKIYETQEAD